MNNTSITPMKPVEKQAFITIMKDAFQNDPLFVTAFGEAGTNQNATGKFLSVMFDMNIALGNLPLGLYENGTLLGCMLIERPITNKFENLYRMSASIIKFIPIMFIMGKKSAKFLNDYMKITRNVSPKTAHHYLTMIGISSDHQGKGFGRKLMQHAVKMCEHDTSSTGIALDTENKSNVAIYQKWNFKQMHEVEIPPISAYCMFREK